MDSKIIESVTIYTDKVKQILPVSLVVLFGSYARGTENIWSDIDLAIITDKQEGNIIEDEYNLYRLRRDVDDRIEPVLFRSTHDKSGFLDSILSYGKVIYKK